MSILGKRIKNFSIPVCSGFHPVLYLDQICFELDIKKVIGDHHDIDEIKFGLTLLLDYNEDRQVNYQIQQLQAREENPLEELLKLDDQEQAIIYLNTKGIKCSKHKPLSLNPLFRASSTER